MKSHSFEPFSDAEFKDFSDYATGRRLLKYLVPFGIIALSGYVIYLILSSLSSFVPIIWLVLIGVSIFLGIIGLFIFLRRKYSPWAHKYYSNIEKDMEERVKEIIRGPIQKKWEDNEVEDISHYITVFGVDYYIERERDWNKLQEGQFMKIVVSKHARYIFYLNPERPQDAEEG